jgi:hypothetical protein
LIGYRFPVPFGELDIRPLIGTPFPILFCFAESDVRPLIGYLFPIFVSFVELDVRPLIGYLFPMLLCGVGRKTIYWHSVSHLISELDVRPFIGIPFPALFSLNLLISLLLCRLFQRMVLTWIIYI